LLFKLSLGSPLPILDNAALLTDGPKPILSSPVRVEAGDWEGLEAGFANLKGGCM
jgi:hypothetical protein